MGVPTHGLSSPPKVHHTRVEATEHHTLVTRWFARHKIGMGWIADVVVPVTARGDTDEAVFDNSEAHLLHAQQESSGSADCRHDDTHRYVRDRSAQLYAPCALGCARHRIVITRSTPS